MNGRGRFGWRDASGEAISNLRASAPRQLASVAAIAGLCFAALFFSASDADAARVAYQKQVTAGRFAFIASPAPASTMTSQECETVNQISGVEAAGAVVAEEQAQVVGDSHHIRVLYVTEGFVRAAFPAAPRGDVAVVAPSGLTATLGLVTGQDLALRRDAGLDRDVVAISYVAKEASRIAGIEDALIRVVAKPSAVRQCVIWTVPSEYAHVGVALRGWFGSGSSLSDFLPQAQAQENPQHRLANRVSAWAWLVAAFGSLILLLLGWFADREQIALYRLLGMREAHVLTMASAHAILIGLMPLQLALAATVVFAGTSPFALTIALADWARVALVIAAFPALAWLLVRPRSTLDYLKGL